MRYSDFACRFGVGLALMAMVGATGCAQTNKTAADKTEAKKEQVQPPYPAALAELGLKDWVCVFNPDLTLPVDQVIGPDVSKTPLTYRTECYDGTIYNKGGMAPYSTGPNGLSMRNTPKQAGMATTTDQMHRGFTITSPAYVEESFTAPYVPGSWNATVFIMSQQAWDPAVGGSSNAMHTAYNRAEFDITEQCTNQNLDGVRNYTEITLHTNTGDSGPAKEAYTYFHGRMPGVTTIWDGPTLWGGLWGDGTKGTSNECRAFFNNKEIWKAPTPASWTNPAPYGPPKMWLMTMMYNNYGYAKLVPPPKTWDFTFTVHYIRVWKPKP